MTNFNQLEVVDEAVDMNVHLQLFLSLSLLIVAVSLWWYRRRQPYAFASQNALEAGLLSSVLFLLLLAIPCHALAAADGTVSPALDAVMTVLVLSSLVGAAFFAFRDLRHQRKHGTPLSLDDQLIGKPPPCEHTRAHSYVPDDTSDEFLCTSQTSQ